jgi:hypothetical protein
VPDRIVADKVVIARPDADKAVVLCGAAAAAWVELEGWTTRGDLESVLAAARPDMRADDRTALLADALAMLDAEGFLEHRSD